MTTPQLAKKFMSCFPLKPKLTKRSILLSTSIGKKDTINSSENIKLRLVLVTLKQESDNINFHNNGKEKL